MIRGQRMGMEGKGVEPNIYVDSDASLEFSCIGDEVKNRLPPSF
jgi:hypothetical protein